MFKELKEPIITEIKEGMMTMLHQIENNNKEKLQKKKQMEVLELENITTVTILLKGNS